MSDVKLEKELAEMRARLDQLTTGRRSEFETALLLGLRRRYAHDASFDFVKEENPTLTKEHADLLFKRMDADNHQIVQANLLRNIYCDMRAALEVMLDQMPAVKDPRYTDPKK